MDRRPDAETLTRSIVAAADDLDDAGRLVSLAIYGLLAMGRPAGADEVAVATSLPLDAVAARIASMRGVYTDAAGAVIGFRGLSLSPTPHRFDAGGVALHTWCALDTLFIPEILDAVAHITTHCPTTGETIKLVVDPTGVRRAEPEGIVMSLLLPKEGFGDDVISSFCHFIHFFVSRAAGEQWIESSPGTFLLGLDEASALAHAMNARMYGALLAST